MPDIVKQQTKNGVSFDFIGGDGYYGNDANLASAINRTGYLYMLDIRCDQKIFVQRPDLSLPERKGSKGPFPKKLKATARDIGVAEYMENLEDRDWKKIVARNTAKGKLTGEYHFARVYIRNRSLGQIEPRMLVIRRTMSDKNNAEIKYSFTNANLEQYTHEAFCKRH